MNRGKKFNLILHQTIFILKFQVHPICFWNWHSSGGKMKFILFWVSDKPMLFIFVKCSGKTRRERQFIILLFTNTQLSKMHIALSIFDDQIYQVSCNAYLTTWDLPRSNIIFHYWLSIVALICIFKLFFSTTFFPSTFKQIQVSFH